MLKCSSDRWVCAPQSLSAGTLTSPRLSISLRMLLIKSRLVFCFYSAIQILRFNINLTCLAILALIPHEHLLGASHEHCSRVPPLGSNYKKTGTLHVRRC